MGPEVLVVLLGLPEDQVEAVAVGMGQALEGQHQLLLLVKEMQVEEVVILGRVMGKAEVVGQAAPGVQEQALLEALLD